MRPNPTAVLPDLWRLLAEQTPDSWTSERPGLLAIDTGVPVPTMNGVLVLEADADPAALVELISELRSRGATFGVQVRPELDEAMAPTLREAGLVMVEEIPFMVLDALDSLNRPRAVPQLTIRTAGHADRVALADAIAVGAAGFDVPADVYAAATHLTMGLPGAVCLVGYLDDTPVTAEIVVPSTHGSFGMFNLATPVEYRGRGFGAAMMIASIEAGFATGATWAWLQASSDGFGVYERLGFTVASRWPFYCVTDSTT